MAEQWYAVYRTADGELGSVGTVVADTLPAGYAKKAIPQPDTADRQVNGAWGRDVWDKAALAFAFVAYDQAEQDRRNERPNAEAAMKQAYAALGQWATDAATASAAYTGMTAAQKNAAVTTLLDRFGKLCTLTRHVLLELGQNG